jgi:hypothetical protein
VRQFREQEDPEPSAPKRAGALTIEVVPQPATNPDANDSVILRFRNIGEKPLFIIKPLDGSFECRFIPYYRLTLIDPDGEPLKPRGGCKPAGLFSDTKWPQDYLVEIAGGEHWDRHFPDIAYRYNVQQTGQHTIAFEYVYEPEKDPGWQGERPTPPPAKAWRGTVRAAPVVMELRPWVRKQ